MYKVIYADPPWTYKKYGGEGGHGKANDHYPTLSKAQIVGMGDQIQELADDNSALFLWAAPPAIDDAREVMDAWGFRYTTWAFLWVKYGQAEVRPMEGMIQPLILGEDNALHKPSFGMGYYTASNPEPCLLGIRGKGMKPAAHLSNLILAPRGEHSAKPEEARRRIMRMYPDGKKLELFARQNTVGWDSWGNECHSTINLEVAK